MLGRLTLASLVALATVSCDESPTRPDGSGAQVLEAQFDAQNGNPVVHRLTVGGADASAFGPPGSDANFSLVAVQRADGTVTGQWSDQYGKGVGMHARIDCLSVEGNTAWVSGQVTRHTDPSLVGRTVNAMVRDGGDTEEDMISAVFFFLPATCVDQFRFDDTPFFWPVNNGQVKLD
ncbi:MAG: hypothetical protein M8835_04400 [marine benthic group bacterium]|jgi:hypothetical protein|nr:hypothetical protein [Gemmatimonadota bacterium]MCL7973781.1 hypothetical protein [Gemmatimonadota bacterium]MCL7977327.1 hypothetical protein [Gemmatimonadota bacterium]